MSDEEWAEIKKTLDKDDILYWLAQQDSTLVEDFNSFFETTLTKDGDVDVEIDLDELLDWIYYHETLAAFFDCDFDIPRYDEDEEDADLMSDEEVDAMYDEIEKAWCKLDKSAVLSWLADHKTAAEDFNNYFDINIMEDTDVDVDLLDIVAWIYEHDTLARDFERHFDSFRNWTVQITFTARAIEELRKKFDINSEEDLQDAILECVNTYMEM